MDDKLASESLKLSNLQIGHSSTTNYFNVADIQADDGSLWGDSDEELDKISDLDRKWKRRHDQFYTIGYRDGLIAGKEASAQEGFNIGFKQSVSVGYNWGVTRGVTSALSCLPDELRERLIETPEKRDRFSELYESVNSLSTTDALKLFYDDYLTKKAAEHSVVVGSQEPSSNSAGLGTYTAKLQSLVLESPEIKLQFFHQLLLKTRIGSSSLALPLMKGDLLLGLWLVISLAAVGNVSGTSNPSSKALSSSSTKLLLCTMEMGTLNSASS